MSFSTKILITISSVVTISDKWDMFVHTQFMFVTGLKTWTKWTILKHAFLREVYKHNTVLQGRSRVVRCSRVGCWCWCAGSWRCLSPPWCGPACGSPCSRGQPWCQVSPGWSNTGTLSCSGPMFSAWLNPPIEPLLRLYVFNITNPEEVGVAGLDPASCTLSQVLLGSDPVTVELGPYVYSSTLERQILQVRHFYFNREISKKNQQTRYNLSFLVANSNSGF